MHHRSMFRFRRARHASAPTLCLALLSATSLMASAPDARACGGLFCSASNPVNQAAERIIFAQGDDTVTAAIEIQYEGPSEQFAWVLPVPPGDVEVGVSSKLAFDRLQQASNPQYNLQTVVEGNCGRSLNPGAGAPSSNATLAADTTTTGAGTSGQAAVTVVASGTAGPYDYTQIEVDPSLDDPSDVAVEWLTENEYDVTALGPESLRGYLEDGLNLLAFRLTKGNNAGSIRPVLITYQGTSPMIPIQPTAIAANDDMGVMVWVLGDSRAIPKNYRHLELNEALINWFSAAPTYNEVVIAAADEAGGQGFVTEQAGPASAFAQIVYQSLESFNWTTLRTGSFETLQAFIRQAVFSFGGHDGFVDVIRDPELVPLREGATPEQFISCVDCYFQQDVSVANLAYPPTPFDPEEDPILEMDVQAFLEGMYALVIEPMELTQQLFSSNAMVTRLYTTLSPEEMTIDPVFDYNDDLPDFDNIHTAQRFVSCDRSGPWRVELDQGVTIDGTGSTWPVNVDDDIPKNNRIIELSTSGQGEVVEDFSADIGDSLLQLSAGRPGVGHGPASRNTGSCSLASASPAQGGATGGWLGLGAVLLGFAGWRRRGVAWLEAVSSTRVGCD